MSKAAFITSVSTPHDGYISSIVSKGSSTVFIEGKAAARIGDSLLPHIHSVSGDTHNPKIAKGSSTVFIEGKAAARIGDKLDCNSFIMSGASTVNIS